MKRSAVVAFIGLGSNLADPVAQVRTAMTSLAAMSHTHGIRRSSLYRSAPVGDVHDQPEFINAACRIETSASAREIMEALLAIEQAQGRVRDGRRGGPRIVDLDLLLYGMDIIQAPDLIVPHPRLHERAFVLYPLHELDPDLIIPGQGPVSELLARCGNQVIERMPPMQADSEVVKHET